MNEEHINEGEGLETRVLVTMYAQNTVVTKRHNYCEIHESLHILYIGMCPHWSVWWLVLTTS